jgi:hypothetical protein
LAEIVAVSEDRKSLPLLGVIYSIEFGDGVMVQVHENDLELHESAS